MKQTITRSASIGFALLAQMAAMETFAVLPPKYLQVPNFDKCLQQKDMGGYTGWCMPAKQPAACPADSWKQLNGLTGTDKVQDC